MKLFVACMISLCCICSCERQPVQIGDNTFVYQSHVYRVIDNQITELGNLNSDSIAQSSVLNSALRTYGEYALDHVKRGAQCNLSAVYRGDILYYKLEVHNLNDLRENYTSGYLIINLLDEYGFNLYDITVHSSDLTRILGSKDETVAYQYNGKTKMSAEIYSAISRYSIASTISARGRY